MGAFPELRRRYLLGDGVGLGFCLGTGLLLLGCGPRAQPRYASMGGKWIVAAGEQGAFFGPTDAPQNGDPLKPLPCAATPPACVSAYDIDSHFGPICNHESEGGAPKEAGDDEARHGIGAPTREVRWYCSGAMVVRVVLEPCTDKTYRPLQVAFSAK